MAKVFRVVEFEFVTKIFVVEMEFDTETLPRTVTVAPIPVAVAMPKGPGMLVRFMVVALDPVTYTDCQAVPEPIAPV
jgi:hypothetical protein